MGVIAVCEVRIPFHSSCDREQDDHNNLWILTDLEDLATHICKTSLYHPDKKAKRDRNTNTIGVS